MVNGLYFDYGVILTWAFSFGRKKLLSFLYLSCIYSRIILYFRKSVIYVITIIFRVLKFKHTEYYYIQYICIYATGHSSIIFYPQNPDKVIINITLSLFY